MTSDTAPTPGIVTSNLSEPTTSRSSLRRFYTLIGDPRQVNLRGGSAYFFLQAAAQQEFCIDGISLYPEQLTWLRWIWNGLQWLKTRGQYGGFQYSPLFLNQLLSQAQLDRSEPLEIISRFPLLPLNPPTHWRITYHIDATLKQNFEDYGTGKRVSYSIQQQAIAQEQVQYQQAERVIGMSRWAADSVVQDYGISPQKVHIIGAGANLDETRLSSSLTDVPADFHRAGDRFSPLRLGFIGKDWKRKGLHYILEVADCLHQRQIPVEVVVIGATADQLPPHPRLRSLGFISKAIQMDQFVAAVRSFHFGCLFSSVEALGISNLECLRLGVPVLGRNIGGIPETIPGGLGHLFEVNDPPEKIANILAEYVMQPETYWALRQQVQARSQEVTWATTVQRFIDVWEGSTQYRYDQG